MLMPDVRSHAAKTPAPECPSLFERRGQCFRARFGLQHAPSFSPASGPPFDDLPVLLFFEDQYIVDSLAFRIREILLLGHRSPVY